MAEDSTPTGSSVAPDPRAAGSEPKPTASPVEASTARDDDSADWSWPPYAPLEPAGGRRFDLEDWAPSSIVWHPKFRLGRWTLLYRRGS